MVEHLVAHGQATRHTRLHLRPQGSCCKHIPYYQNSKVVLEHLAARADAMRHQAHIIYHCDSHDSSIQFCFL